jgi:hypothetical protein
LIASGLIATRKGIQAKAVKVTSKVALGPNFHTCIAHAKKNRWLMQEPLDVTEIVAWLFQLATGGTTYLPTHSL